MQEHSTFVADCLCGRHFETPLREYVCPTCKRRIVLEWRSDSQPEPGRAGNEPPAREVTK